jgi:peptidoglycan/xylan/chitin deacetylase (PgdA/CDA1 family)
MVTRSRTVLAALVLLGSVGDAAAAEPPSAQGPAQSCHNPDALGVSRTIEVGGAPELGLKTYPRTLDLRDHEVVLTFDDGPWGPTTPDVLAALAAQCVKATFFLIGRNAQAHPELVKREVAEGHTVGHHTFDHPGITLRNMSAEAGIEDIEHGMRVDDRAAGDEPWTGTPRVPFFRYPGFGDSPGSLAWLKARGVAVFGADLWASDWIPMTPDAELDLLMGRLRGAGRGIILLHDIKRQTADMLPRFLSALKAEGFHVVRIVPGGTATPTRDAPAGWSSETDRTLAHLWPKTRADIRAEARPVAPRAAAPAGDAAAGLKPSVQ